MNAVAKRPSVGSHCYCFPHWPIPLPEKNFRRKLNIARDARTNKQTTKLLANTTAREKLRSEIEYCKVCKNRQTKKPMTSKTAHRTAQN